MTFGTNVGSAIDDLELVSKTNYGSRQSMKRELGEGERSKRTKERDEN